jgi:Tetracyclin repressor-like, C-terminal domain
VVRGEALADAIPDSALELMAADTGDLRGDLAQAILQMRDSRASQDGALILGLLNAMRDNGELAGHVRGQVLSVKRSVIGGLVARAIERGELPARADHELASEIASALVFTRILVTGQPLDDAEIARIVDAVLMPVLTRDSKDRPKS